MEDKESYTHKEVKEMFEALKIYELAEKIYTNALCVLDSFSKEEIKSYNKTSIEAQQNRRNKIPRSLLKIIEEE